MSKTSKVYEFNTEKFNSKFLSIIKDAGNEEGKWQKTWQLTFEDQYKVYDIDLESISRNAQGKASGPKVAGEVFLAMRRFIPDFKTLQGNAKVSLNVKRYPQQTSSQTALSPFTITSSTDKKDTRARGRSVSLKIENDSTSESWRFGTLRLDIQNDGRR